MASGEFVDDQAILEDSATSYYPMQVEGGHGDSNSKEGQKHSKEWEEIERLASSPYVLVHL